MARVWNSVWLNCFDYSLHRNPQMDLQCLQFNAPSIQLQADTIHRSKKKRNKWMNKHFFHDNNIFHVVAPSLDGWSNTWRVELRSLWFKYITSSDTVVSAHSWFRHTLSFFITQFNDIVLVLFQWNINCISHAVTLDFVYDKWTITQTLECTSASWDDDSTTPQTSLPILTNQCWLYVFVSKSPWN